MKHHLIRFFCIVFLYITVACNSTKYVSQKHYLLNNVKIKTDNKEIKSTELRPFLRQEPNHKSFGLFRFSLFLYNLSGNDSTKFYNRWLRKLGNPPVIYSDSLTRRSEAEIKKVLNNKGYLNAVVNHVTTEKKKKINLDFEIQTNRPYLINSYNYNIINPVIKQLIETDSTVSMIKPGMKFDRSILESERQRITSLLRNKGYYAFNKNNINFTADTALHNNEVDLQLNLLPLRKQLPNGTFETMKNRTYEINDVCFITDYDPMTIEKENRFSIKDSVYYKGYSILYGKKKYLRPSVLVDNCFITPGQLYSDKSVDRTYSAFGRLRILKYINIKFTPSQSDTTKLDCYILLTEGKSQSISTDLEGTNSAGDLGFAIGAGYQHRNLFKGSEIFSIKARGAYESLTGDISGVLSNNYYEYGIENSLQYPKFLFPFLSQDFKKQIRANTEFLINYNFQHRPEYTRIIAGGGWRYKWLSHQNIYRHSLDLVDVSYIYLPWSKPGFIDGIAPDNPVVRYSYENHFISRTAYNFYQTNLVPGVTKRDVYTMRSGIEIAGNVLYGFSKLTGQKVGNKGEYTIFGIRYSQYVKGDLDYSYQWAIGERNALACHVGFGLAYPYGNSEILPFEKRYFSGGANSVRGWSVRALGPGRYKGRNSSSEFINQCGDIRFDFNLEYRTKLFWKIELAAFIDAGNIWTIRKYENQPGGEFKINQFYKEIALAYGLGVRFDFSFFVMRFDLGIKAYDPAMLDTNPWVFNKHANGGNTTFHFAVGYPF